MTERKQHARAAGFWYLFMAITAGFGTMYVPMGILVSGDSASTTQNIINAGWIYPLSIAGGLIGQASFIFLALAFYRLFQDVDRHQSRLLVVLVAAAVPILIVQVFWGLWLLPLGLLFIRATFMPTWLGILLIINCFAYLILTFTQLLELKYVEVITYTLMPFLLIGEFSAIFWLLFVGVKKELD
jgi:hypothetical protein